MKAPNLQNSFHIKVDVSCLWKMFRKSESSFIRFLPMYTAAGLVICEITIRIQLATFINLVSL